MSHSCAIGPMLPTAARCAGAPGSPKPMVSASDSIRSSVRNPRSDCRSICAGGTPVSASTLAETWWMVQSGNWQLIR